MCERTRYQKQTFTVPNMRAVLKKASWGTRRVFGSIRCKKQASTVRKRYSVPKTAFCGTRRVFKGPQNSRLHRPWTASWGTRRIFRGVPCQKQHLPHRTHLQCAKRLRSEVIRLKRGRPLSLSRLFGPVSYFDGIVRSPEAAYCLLISS